MTEPNKTDACPAHCAGCPASQPGPARPGDLSESGSAEAAGGCLAQHPAPGQLAGGRFVLAAAYVFIMPLIVLLAAVLALSGSLGELGALAAGAAAAAVLLVPAWWLLQRRPAKEVDS